MASHNHKRRISTTHREKDMCQSVVVRARTHTTHILFMSVIYLKLPWPGTKKRYRRFRRLLNRLDVFFCAPINMDERHVYIHFRLVVWRKNGIVIVCGLWVEKMMCGMRERCLWIFVKILLFLGRDDSVMKAASCEQHYGHYMGCLTRWVREESACYFNRGCQDLKNA